MRRNRRTGAEDPCRRGVRGRFLNLRVEQVYGFASIQATPRNGLRHFGVPPGGAFDLEAHSWANAMVGNSPDAATLELSLASIVLRATSSVRVALAGASVERLVNGKAAQELFLGENDELSIFPPVAGTRTYIAVAGGFVTPKSLVTERVMNGALLEVGSSLQSAISELATDVRGRRDPSILSVTRTSCRHSDAIDHLIGLPLSVGFSSDRAGIRLEGAPPLGLDEQLSEPVCVGAIQATPDGTLIIVGPDGPTIGGYPIIAVTPRSARSQLAQLRPGSTISLRLQGPYET